jgi:hypothetical protein
MYLPVSDKYKKYLPEHETLFATFLLEKDLLENRVIYQIKELASKLSLSHKLDISWTGVSLYLKSAGKENSSEWVNSIPYLQLLSFIHFVEDNFRPLPPFSVHNID